MEREKEIAKLVNVLRRTSRMALHSEWTGGKEDAARYCAEQYNRVLARLKELDQSVGTVFEPLPVGSSLMVAAMACRQLAAYYEDEVGTRGPGGARAYAFQLDRESFKEFWQKSAREIEDLGEYIRESIEEWVRQRKGKPEAGRASGQTGDEKGQ
ncbi:MAG TPA: hypothetical protein VF717_12810 [Pyrinomonadaceae bacterium]|jgi:hypothetical protein